MGSAPSTPYQNGPDDPWWPIENQNLTLNPSDSTLAMDERSADAEGNGNRSPNDTNVNCDDEIENVVKPNRGVEVTNANETCEGVSAEAVVSKAKDFQSLEEFKEELRVKREQRQNAIGDLRNEISLLRSQLAAEKELNKQLLEERNPTNASEDRVDSQVDRSSRIQLADVQLSLQTANGEILRLTAELAATKKQVNALKEVIVASKEMAVIREDQLLQLKTKLTQIESSLAEREMQLMSENLRQEYDRQLANIRNLRALYKERARVSAAERENLNRRLETSRAELNSEIEKNKNLEEHIASLDADLKSTSGDLYGTREQVAYYKAESKNLQDEMAVINQLFSQLLAGFNGCNNIDIDKLTHMLEENRDLLHDITNRECSREEAAQLPKILFDLMSQASDAGDLPTLKPEIDFESESVPSTSAVASIDSSSNVSSAQEILSNLPKVWKVLIELLNHQKIPPTQFTENAASEDCYKSVETPSGPQMVLSVSKTYIRLKDLILEKKFLQKETKKLKNFNSHLETRLEEQEKRLSAVSLELNKTWNLVGRMQRQHRQLHTQEQVLRYQLQQKRRILGELKEELEYCRRKWALAKEKNKESQSQWDSLRLEFSRRKETDAHNSAESGYSDSPASEDDEENVGSVTNRQGNKEKFLSKVDLGGRKMSRIHSVSPIRCAKEVILTRRNSDTTITQFATEMFQVAAPVVVQPIVHAATAAENSVKIGVHFGNDSSASTSSAQVKVSEANVHNTKSKTTAAVRKLIESKASTSKSKTCFEQRTSRTAQKNTGEGTAESLEAMFMRLSGQSTEPDNNDSSDDDESECISREENDSSEPNALSENDEKYRLRVARIQRLEEQCKSLLSQVTKTSNRNDELNKQADQIQRRFTPVRETKSLPPRAHTIDVVDDHREPMASTSSASTAKPDEECLTQAEREYTTRRHERLKRLEAECKAFLDKANERANRVIVIDNQTGYLHGRHSGETTLETSQSTVAEETLEVDATDAIDGDEPGNTSSGDGETISGNSDETENVDDDSPPQTS